MTGKKFYGVMSPNLYYSEIIEEFLLEEKLKKEC